MFYKGVASAHDTRGSVVSLSFRFTHPPGGKQKEKQNAKDNGKSVGFTTRRPANKRTANGRGECLTLGLLDNIDIELAQLKTWAVKYPPILVVNIVQRVKPRLSYRVYQG